MAASAPDAFAGDALPQQLQQAAANARVIVAHRGASGYAPEHTPAAKELGVRMGADFIEQDLVVTKDRRIVILHDIFLEISTNVKEVYPARHRADGKYYAADFTPAEIKKLKVNHPGRRPVPQGFRVGKDHSVPTLEAEIRQVQGLNKALGTRAGFYAELKSPAWHAKEMPDFNYPAEVARIFKKAGYTRRTDPVVLQSFNHETLRTLRKEVGSDLRLVLLVGENSWKKPWRNPTTDYEYFRTPEGLRELATFADGVAPWANQVLVGQTAGGRPVFSDLIHNAHAAGLFVHLFTWPGDEPFKVPVVPTPGGGVPIMVQPADDAEGLLKILAKTPADGIFTDFPDLGVQLFKKAPAQTAAAPCR
jgi:glycerophosphoryl diester phosphodiesterase